MRNGRARALLVAVVLGAAVSAVLIARRGGREVRGPVLVVRAIAGDAGAPAPPRPDSEERAMALAAASMSPADRHHVLELVDYATARLEARLSPLGTDFDSGDPVAQLQSSLAPYAPAFTASRALERGAAEADDLAVRVAASCGEAHVAPGERCISMGDAASDSDPQAKRARFLAWAASHAKVVDLATRERAEACARALRARAALESSPIALVLLDDDLGLHASPERAELQIAAQRLGRAMAANGLHDTEGLEGFARIPREERVAPWLALSPSQLVVIPRLSALSRVLTVDCP